MGKLLSAIAAVPVLDVESDRLLVENCLSGDPAAWTALYRACHDPLVRAIRLFLREAASDLNLVDEIAARVWYAVVRNEGELLSRFDVSRGCRLGAFFAAIAKNEARKHFRAERRRRTREESASRPEGAEQPPAPFAVESIEREFLATLTPKERTYYQSVLTAKGDDDSYSDGNAWQLRSRVRKKLRSFLE